MWLILARAIQPTTWTSSPGATAARGRLAMPRGQGRLLFNKAGPAEAVNQRWMYQFASQGQVVKYARPEMNILGEATEVIQDFTKSMVIGLESVDPTSPWATTPGYDLDD